MSERLSKSDWIDHGLHTLTAQGPGALKVGPMAARLKVSRGSFYWHFRDIADFRDALLRRLAGAPDRPGDPLSRRPPGRNRPAAPAAAGRLRERAPARPGDAIMGGRGSRRRRDRGLRGFAASLAHRQAARRFGRRPRSRPPPRGLPLLGVPRPGRGHGAARRHAARGALDDIATLFET
jgi:AcrR family transcriptional regulator